MLKSLNYSVTFPTTGRKLANTISFQNGFGSITGPNEAGKSFVIEMVRFCLFGAKALRGKSDDYKTLKATMEWSLRGDDYKVVRSITSAKLFRGTDEIAVGITPVNSKIVSLLGFGLDVFDISCVANQGAIEQLGAMRPADRKRMVDNVVGMAIFDDVAKWANDRAALLTKEADTLERTLRKPVAPEQPSPFYEDIQALTTSVQDAENAAREAAEIRGWLSRPMTEPVEPAAPFLKLTAQELQIRIDGQQKLRFEIQSVEQQLKAIPSLNPSVDEAFLSSVEAQWTAYEAWLARVDFLKRHRQPELTIDDALAGLETWKAIFNWDYYDQLAARLAELRKAGTHVCPACSHEWPCEQHEIDAVVEKMDGVTSTFAERPIRPSKPKSYFEAQVVLNSEWVAAKDEWEKVKDAVEVARPALSRIQIEQCREALKMQALAEPLRQKLADLKHGLSDTDWSKALRERLAYEAAVEQHRKRVAEYEAWVKERDQKDERLNQIWMLAEVADDLRKSLAEHRAYHNERQRFDRDLEAYEKAFTEVRELKAQADQWRKAKAALTRLRVMVKQQLVPSLNKVASHLIKGMTAGQRQKIEVNEDFEITVDGQDLDTLSGSGKAVANLALRLGLGQVLTNNVLSLFIGDEIDASMDENRAEATSDTLHSLTQFIRQILLVSHKYPDADYTIELEAV